MALQYVNPNSCNKPDCYLVFNDAGNKTVPTLINGILTLTDDSGHVVKIPYADILPGNAVEMKCSAAGTNRTTTVTVNTAPSTACCGFILNYNVSITWQGTCENPITKTYPIQGFGDAADTTTTIATKIAAAITADADAAVTATSSTNVVTIVGKNTSIVFQTDVTASIMTAVVTVNGYPPSGFTADLVAMGIPLSLLTAAATYQILWIPYKFYSPATGQADNQGNVCNVVCQHSCAIIVQENGTAEAAILTNAGTLEDALEGTVAGSLTLPSWIGRHSTTWCHESP